METPVRPALLPNETGAARPVPEKVRGREESPHEALSNGVCAVAVPREGYCGRMHNAYPAGSLGIMREAGCSRSVLFMDGLPKVSASPGENRWTRSCRQQCPRCLLTLDHLNTGRNVPVARAQE